MKIRFNPRSRWKPVLGLYVAVLSGGIGSSVAVGALSYCRHGILPAFKQSLNLVLPMGLVTLPMCLASFAPIYFLVPRTHVIWKTFVCVPLGAFAGYLTLLELRDPMQPAPTVLPEEWIPAAIAGAAVWLTATKMYNWFHSEGVDSVELQDELPRNVRRLFLFSTVAQITIRAMFAIGEMSGRLHTRYYVANHPWSADVISATLWFTGVFLVIFTPLYFERLGHAAIPVWLVSVAAMSGFLASFLPQ